MTTLTFSASDGKVTTLQTVKVQVLDVNRAPRIQVANHALVVGQAFQLTVGLGADAGLVATDHDGATQTQNLHVSFSDLPEGAVFDAVARQLDWTPGPGQIGDYVITALVQDAFEEVRQTFTLRVLAEASAGGPKILVVATPSTPVNPGQTVFVTVRADGYSAITSLDVRVRGSGLSTDQWQTMALDSRGRIKLIATNPGLIEVEAHATDADGFATTYTHTLRIKNPADKEAPALAWDGALDGSSAQSLPVPVQGNTPLRASMHEAQLMGYSLAITHAHNDEWKTLAENTSAASSVDAVVNLFELDPARFLNGVYKLRLSAWDLVGRTSDIEALVVIDSAEKALDEEQACDRVFTLGNHAFALNRTLTTGLGADKHDADFANWHIPAFDFRLSHDQPLETEQGGTAPWEEGARVWLRIPNTLSQPNAEMLDLAFTLGTTPEAMQTGADAPTVRHPVLGESQGFGLVGYGADEDLHDNERPDTVQLLGRRLYDQLSGLPWVPQRFVLIGPDGTKYSLDVAGRLKSVTFADGTRWLVTNAGVVAAGADTRQRIEFLRDTNGRIKRVSGAVSNGGQAAIAYRYDKQGRLVLARALDSADMGTAYAYWPNGKTYSDVIVKNLGAALSWIAPASANGWEGTLGVGQTTTVAFSVRESEIESTVKVRGASGAVLIAIQTTGVTSLEVTEVVTLGQTTSGGVTTTLVRVREAGLKLVRLLGNGNASVHVAIAGDIVRDGNVDGLDTQAFNAGGANADVDGDGVVNQKDRQTLYANYGFRANKGPVVAATLPVIKTHTDLPGRVTLNAVAQDFEGDDVFWRVLGATHGNARLSGDGQTLWFEPEPGYAGSATVQVQADDGFVASAPIDLAVQVSGAKLVGLKIEPLPVLEVGQTMRMGIVVDFEDETGVRLERNSGFLEIVTEDLAPLGYTGPNAIAVDAAQALVMAKAKGCGLIRASRTDALGRTVRAVRTVNVIDALPYGQPKPKPPLATIAVYPESLALVPGATRQLKAVKSTGDAVPIHEEYPAGTQYWSGNETIATITTTGNVNSVGNGKVTLSVIRLDTQFDVAMNIVDQVIGQKDVVVTVQQAQVCSVDAQTGAVQRILVGKSVGGAVMAVTGETVLIGAGALERNTDVAIQRIDLNDVESTTGMSAPAPDVLQLLGAFRLDLGDKPIASPVQLSIPLQDSTGMQPGDEVYFLRAGTINGLDGRKCPTWWFVDNGVLALDSQGTLIASTSSPPYQGSVAGGNLVIGAKVDRSSQQQTGALKVKVILFNMDVFWALQAGVACAGMLAAGPSLGGSMAAVEVMAIFALAAVPIFAHEYSYDGAHKWRQIKKNIDIDGRITLDLEDTPTSTVEKPNALQATSVVFDDAGNKLAIKVAGLGNTPANTMLRIWLSPSELSFDENGDVEAPGTFGNGLWSGTAPLTEGIRTWMELPREIIEGNQGNEITLTREIPAGIALGIHFVTLQQLVEVDNVHACGFFEWKTSDFEPLRIRLKGRADISVVTTGHQIEIIRRGEVVKQLKYADYMADVPGLPHFVGGYHADQLAFSIDNRLLFVAGTEGHIVIVDLVTLRIVDYWSVPGARESISSLAVSRTYLYVATGGTYSDSSSRKRLLRVNINSFDRSFLATELLILPPEVSGPSATYGYFDLAVLYVQNDYLAVTASQTPLYLDNRNASTPSGQVFILNLGHADSDGCLLHIPPSAMKLLEFPDGKGRGPQHITPADFRRTASGWPLALRFLLSNALDPDSGLVSVEIPIGALGNMYGTPEIKVIKMDAEVPGQTMYQRLMTKYQMNVQRTHGAVLYVDPDTEEEYAIVADYHMIFNNPWWPDNQLGKQAGGKIGVIKDPFGNEPEYLGCTTPILEASLRNLRISSDNKTLWAIIVYWAEIGDSNPPQSGLLSFSLSDLIYAANTRRLQSRPMPKLIPFDREGTRWENEQIGQVTPQKLDFGWVFDMKFDEWPNDEDWVCPSLFLRVKQYRIARRSASLAIGVGDNANLTEAEKFHKMAANAYHEHNTLISTYDHPNPPAVDQIYDVWDTPHHQFTALLTSIPRLKYDASDKRWTLNTLELDADAFNDYLGKALAIHVSRTDTYEAVPLPGAPILEGMIPGAGAAGYVVRHMFETAQVNGGEPYAPTEKFAIKMFVYLKILLDGEAEPRIYRIRNGIVEKTAVTASQYNKEKLLEITHELESFSQSTPLIPGVMQIHVLIEHNNAELIEHNNFDFRLVEVHCDGDCIFGEDA